MSDPNRSEIPPPRRRPATGGYARGDEKQARIIQAALRCFGEEGFDGASTREIATEAGVNPPALQYYFGGKEGLYLACGAYIADRFETLMQPLYRRIKELDGSSAGALDLLCDIMDILAEFMFGIAEAEGLARFMARSLNNDGGGPRDDMLGRRLEDELQDNCTRLVGLVIGKPGTAVETRLRTIAITGQLNAFLVGHETVLTRLGWPDIRGPRLRKLKAILRAQTTAALAAKTPENARD